MSKIIIFMILFILSISLYSQRDSSLLYFGPSFDNVLNPGLNRISIEHNGINRTFWVETPDSYSSNHNYPVLMYFHYYGGSGGTTSMSSMVNNENFIDIWCNQKFSLARKNLFKANRNFAPCDKCDVAGTYMGGDHAKAWQQTK